VIPVVPKLNVKVSIDPYQTNHEDDEGEEGDEPPKVRNLN
jgi:hypothetical protein